MGIDFATLIAAPATQATELQAATTSLDSLFGMVLKGGPLMAPIALCSVVALGYAIERWLRLRPHLLGTRRFGRELLEAVREGGSQRGLEVCEKSRTPLARILRPALARWGAPFLEVEKVVEDAGSREVRRLSVNLKPLVVVAAIAPLLGLLGTVWGMILAFSTIALEEGLGKPELLAQGISQALITTAAGLSIAIPTQAAYFFLKGRIDRFARLSEDVYGQLIELRTAGGGHANS